MDFHTILVIIHIVGVILGVGGATMAEVNIVRALKDGKVDTSEKHLMHGTYTMIRVGTFIVILSGFALVWWIYFAEGSTWPLESAKVWAKQLITLAIVVNAWLLTKHRVPLWLGSAVSFTSWWGATVLGLWSTDLSFLTLTIGYIVAIFVVAAVLEGIRRYYLR